jgi:hypothetical protein
LATAIRTDYHGQQFRSKLEAKWAMVLDELQVVWEYEPEARYTQHGGYLPDFYLPRMKGGLWLEIKPYDAFEKGEDPRWPEFAMQRDQPLVVAYGLSDPYQLPDAYGEQPGVCIKCFPDGAIDQGYLLTCCLVCGSVGFEFEGRGARACSNRLSCYGRPDADRGHNPDDGRIIKALVAARAAFCGQIPGSTVRTLPDVVVERLAEALAAETAMGASASKWLDSQHLSGGDREAVVAAWGRLID